MGIAKLFGLKIIDKRKDTKVSKSPRVSLTVNVLRGRIDSEYRENFPSLTRYKEISRDAQAVYRILDTMIVNKDHADAAIRMRDDLKKKLDVLGAKINQNASSSNKVFCGEADLQEMQKSQL
jgi:hypothetical protein